LDLFPSSGEERETSTLLRPLERAKLNHWMERDGASEMSLFPSYLEFRMMSISPVIPNKPNHLEKVKKLRT
jgi:hypothetical protein